MATFRERGGAPPNLGLGGPAPRDIVVLVGVIFGLFALNAFESAAVWLRWLELSEAAWRQGLVWQVVTYAFNAHFNGLFILFSLLAIYLFGRDVFYRLGRRRFWRLLLAAVAGGGVAALATQVLLDAAGFGPTMVPPFALMQGEQTLVAILIAAFSLLMPHATIYLFFVLAVPARIFLWLELVITFIFFLGSKDFAGLIGIYAAIGVTAWMLRSGGGSGSIVSSWLRRFERWRAVRRYEKTRGKSGLRLVKPGDDRWVH